MRCLKDGREDPAKQVMVYTACLFYIFVTTVLVWITHMVDINPTDRASHSGHFPPTLSTFLFLQK